MTSVYAVNLDQCVARMVQEVDAGLLNPRFRLVGPLQADLDFLAGSLRERGWLTVAEYELEKLFLPGALELMGALTEFLGRLGKLTRFYPTLDDENSAGAHREVAAPVSDGDLLLPRFLGPEAGLALNKWRQDRGEVNPDLSLANILVELEPFPWFRSVLADPTATYRARQAVQQLDNISLVDLVDHPLWEFWWHTARARLGMTDLSGQRPLVTLVPSELPCGVQEFAGVYLCLGSELPRHHYNVLSRLTDQVLILYKEKCPLAPEVSP